jgi:hypothetical protein
MGGWAIVVNCLFPIPLISLLILCIPLPNVVGSPVRRITNRILSNILFPPVVNGFNLYQIATTVSVALFVEASVSTLRSQAKLDHAVIMRDERLMCAKWRNERNFWIAFLSLVLWLILYRVYKLTKDLEFYKSEVRGSEKPHSN